MKKLEEMRVEEVVEDFNRFVSVHDPEFKHIKELARRLADDENAVIALYGLISVKKVKKGAPKIKDTKSLKTK